MIVVDSGAMIVLIDRDHAHHERLRTAYEAQPAEWVLPWAVLPEVDYITQTRLGQEVARAFRGDVARGTLQVEWHEGPDLARAVEIEEMYRDLSLGLVDAVVMAVAERLRARAIATLNLRDFGAVALAGNPEIWPRDLPGGG